MFAGSPPQWQGKLRLLLTLPPSIISCPPLTIIPIPWTNGTVIPIDGTPAYLTFFDDPSKDGVALYVNFGDGARYSTNTSPWLDPGYALPYGLWPTTDIGFYYDYPNIRLDGAVYYSGTNTVETGIVAEFQITNSTVGSWYAFKGGNQGATQGTTLILAPGRHAFPGIAATDGWYQAGYIQALNTGYPVWFEMYFDTSRDRANPGIGYNEYTMYGDQGNIIPWAGASAGTSAIVRRYVFGIFDLSADLSLLTSTDILAGCILTYDSTDTIVNVVVNRIIVLTQTFTGAVSEANGWLETAASFTPAQAGNYAGTLSDLGIDWIGATSGTLSFSPTGLDWPAFFDSRRTKFGWYIDVDHALSPGTIDENYPFAARPPIMYTHPGWPICVPTTFVLDTFTGTGDLLTHVGEIGATWATSNAIGSGWYPDGGNTLANILLNGDGTLTPDVYRQPMIYPSGSVGLNDSFTLEMDFEVSGTAGPYTGFLGNLDTGESYVLNWFVNNNYFEIDVYYLPGTGSPTQTLTWFLTPSIIGRGPQTLKIVCTPTTKSFYLNEIFQTSFDDSRITSGVAYMYLYDCLSMKVSKFSITA